jgi:hypothetical protein
VTFALSKLIGDARLRVLLGYHRCFALSACGFAVTAIPFTFIAGKPDLRYGMILVKSEANCVQLIEAAFPPPQQPTLSGRVAQLAEQLTLNQ